MTATTATTGDSEKSEKGASPVPSISRALSIVGKEKHEPQVWNKPDSEDQNNPEDQNRELKTCFKRLLSKVDKREDELDFSCINTKPSILKTGFEIKVKLERSKDKVPVKVDLSTLEKCPLDSKRNILHYAITEPVTIKATEDDDDDDDDEVEPLVDGVYPDTPLGHRCNFVLWLLLHFPRLLDERDSEGKTPLCLLIETHCEHMKAYNSEWRPWGEAHLKKLEAIIDNPKYDVRKRIVEIMNRPLPRTSGSGKSTPGGSLVHLALRHLGPKLEPFLELIKPETMHIQDQANETPLHIAVDVHRWATDHSAHERVQLIRGLLRLCDKEALKLKSGNTYYAQNLKKAPYLFMVQKKKEYDSQENLSKRKSVEEAFKDAQYVLKDAYVRYFEDAEIREHIHEGNKDGYLRLDLRESLPKPGEDIQSKISDTDSFLRVMKFEVILKEVWLPRRLLSDQLKNAEQVTVAEYENYLNYEQIFDRLREKGVRKVIKLVVEDNERLPHSHDSIVRAMKGIEVDVWDWRQDDLASRTIIEAAGTAHTVRLYSTGRMAVLQNWESGLKNLKQLKNLHITIDYRKRPQSRLEESFSTYKASLREQYPGVAINLATYSLASKPNDEDFNSSSHPMRIAAGAQTSSWLNTMRSFASFIKSIPETSLKPVPEVKIAIIDDGIDVGLNTDMPGCVVDGMSFHPVGESAQGRHHFPSSSGHGTTMAQCILDIFPKAKLYVARMETFEGLSMHGTPSFTASSAAEAIDWAVGREVDIISMSWTIDGTSNDEQEKNSIKKMRNALLKASQQGILMFCAAKDNPENKQTINPGYPSNSGAPMFLVGGATITGDRSPRLGKQSVDLLCPESPGPSSDTSESLRGSSIATAFAAGLAGLIIYCITLREHQLALGKLGVQEARGKPTGDDRSLEHLTMKNLLREMSGTGTEGQVWLPVDKYFNTGEIRNWSDMGAEEMLKKTIQSLQLELNKANAW